LLWGGGWEQERGGGVCYVDKEADANMSGRSSISRPLRYSQIAFLYPNMACKHSTPFCCPCERPIAPPAATSNGMSLRMPGGLSGELCFRGEVPGGRRRLSIDIDPFLGRGYTRLACMLAGNASKHTAAYVSVLGEDNLEEEGWPSRGAAWYLSMQSCSTDL